MARALERRGQGNGVSLEHVFELAGNKIASLEIR
jgi:hypothetical protein